MGIPRWRLVVATLLFMCAISLIQEEGFLGLVGFAASITGGLIALFHGKWNEVHAVLLQLWKIVTLPHQRATKQRYCAICRAPVRYKVIHRKALELTRPVTESSALKCVCCGTLANYQVETTISPSEKMKGRPAIGEFFLCKEHHPNSSIGTKSLETEELFVNKGAAPQWVRKILYPEHVKPRGVESYEHYVCGDHHVHHLIGTKSEETIAYLSGKQQTWESVYPVYNDAGLFSSSGGRELPKKD